MKAKSIRRATSGSGSGSGPRRLQHHQRIAARSRICSFLRAIRQSIRAEKSRGLSHGVELCGVFCLYIADAFTISPPTFTATSLVPLSTLPPSAIFHSNGKVSEYNPPACIHSQQYPVTLVTLPRLPGERLLLKRLHPCQCRRKQLHHPPHHPPHLAPSSPNPSPPETAPSTSSMTSTPPPWPSIPASTSLTSSTPTRTSASSTPTTYKAPGASVYCSRSCHQRPSDELDAMHRYQYIRERERPFESTWWSLAR